MKGMKRIWKKQPRWHVQLERISTMGTARWFTAEKFHDPVEAWEYMLTTEQRSVRSRIWDCKVEAEMMWPGHNYTMPPKRRVWVGVDPAMGFNQTVWSAEIMKQYEKLLVTGHIVDNLQLATV